MKPMTPAEERDFLLREYGKTYVETRLALGKWLFAGGRAPGTTFPPESELRQHFESTIEAYWHALHPEEAKSQISQWEKIA